VNEVSFIVRTYRTPDGAKRLLPSTILDAHDVEATEI
jgi:hypothetical protein